MDSTRCLPHVRDGVDLTRIVLVVVVALLPVVGMALWNTGYQANLAITQLGRDSPQRRIALVQ